MIKKKVITVLLASFFVVCLLLILGVIVNFKNYESPREYFSIQEKPNNIYLEFKQGGNLKLYSKVSDNLAMITEELEIKRFIDMLESLDPDVRAPHRGDRDYSVYINFENYTDRKWHVKMSSIDGGYVFFFRRGKYRNNELARYINELLEIDHE